MNLLSFGLGLVDQFLQVAHWSGIFHTAFIGHVAYTVYRTIPHNVFNIDVVTDQIFVVVVYINDSGQTVTMLSEIIQKAAVLSEFINICRIIIWSVIVTENKD